MKRALVYPLVVVMFTAVAGAIYLGVFSLGTPDRIKGLRDDFNAGDLTKVLTDAQELVARDSDNVEALLALATTHAMRGSISFAERADGGKAIEYADQALRVNPFSSEAYRIKGYAYEIQELYTEAHKNYDIAIKLDPKNFQALNNKAHAFDLQGEWIKAEELYVRAIEIEPRADHTLLNLGRLHARQGKLEEAQASLRKVINTSHSVRMKAEASQILAEVLMGQGLYQEAKNAIEGATIFDPKLPQAWVSRGRIELALYMKSPGPPEETVKAMTTYAERALEIHPSQASAFVLLADAMLLANDMERYQRYRSKALMSIDSDITLGAVEKAELREYLTTEVKVEESIVEEDGAPGVVQSPGGTAEVGGDTR